MGDKLKRHWYDMIDMSHVAAEQGKKLSKLNDILVTAILIQMCAVEAMISVTIPTNITKKFEANFPELNVPLGLNFLPTSFLNERV